MYWPCGVPRVYTEPGQEFREERGINEAGDDRSETDRSDTVSSAQHAHDESSANIIGIEGARKEHVFATITSTSLSIWSTRPVTVLARTERSSASIEQFGPNTEVLLRPDAGVAILRTSKSYLLTYALRFEDSVAYQQRVEYSHSRRNSMLHDSHAELASNVPKVILRYRRAIQIQAGINCAIALDQELIVATTKPSAIQSIRWVTDVQGPQTSSESLSKMGWLEPKSAVTIMTFNRAMNMFVWIANSGHAYVVQKAREARSSVDGDIKGESDPRSTFIGHCFHQPDDEGERAELSAINAKFSLIALSTNAGNVVVYVVKDYTGNIQKSHTVSLPASTTTTGILTKLSWSPDGYCLFAAFQHGWSIWSVFGKPGSTSFVMNESLAEANHEDWLLGIQDFIWLSGGSDIMLCPPKSDQIWKLELSRSAATGCFSSANLVRALLHTSSEAIVYRGHDLPDLMSISNDASLWHHAIFPSAYVQAHGPVRMCVVSQDGRYVAIAGRRGLAHYSVQSGRWKTFADPAIQDSFSVRGGMAWFGHVLAVGTESEGSYQLRLYFREDDLGSSPAYIESLSAPVIFMGPSGEESLLVYTHENLLYHYVVNLATRNANVVPVGQIAFHGVIRAPTRVRAISWVLPDSQLRTGDPSRDVEFAAVLFLVDDKLVLLQPSYSTEGLKYDMRVIAQQVEFYILMRDEVYYNFAIIGDGSSPSSPAAEAVLNSVRGQNAMRDSLWTFGGDSLHVWSDVKDVLRSAAEEATALAPLTVPVDFYPLSILLNKGIVLGIESELIQRRDVPFSSFKSNIRTHLFIPYILRNLLAEQSDTAASLRFAKHYENLSYFPHALEILLHHVLDDEADGKLTTLEGIQTSMLPTVLSFLQSVLSPKAYLSTVVQCIRKTEFTSWKILLQYLPTPVELFEQALQLDDLKTASSYLMVVQGLEEDDGEDLSKVGSFVIRLMKLGREQHDFELCAELAQFMISLDPSGAALRRVTKGVDFGNITSDSARLTPRSAELGVVIPKTKKKEALPTATKDGNTVSPSSADYFSASPGM